MVVVDDWWVESVIERNGLFSLKISHGLNLRAVLKPRVSVFLAERCLEILPFIYVEICNFKAKILSI